MRTNIINGMVAAALALFTVTQSVAAKPVTEGTLLALAKDSQASRECPLKRTDVKADVSGFIARVTVTQEFHNTAADKIEGVYVFPLPHMAAVDTMDMYVGDRHVKGVIKRREEARAIYEAARDAGRMAAMLDQERPNIFSQHVANIRGGEKVRIIISYVERLKYEDGSYEWVFPMVVGPRYIPGTPVSKVGGGWSPDTDRVPDASKITPAVARPGTRAGHDISVAVSVDAGVPIQNLSSTSHEILAERPAIQRASIRLKDKDVIPNKDFVLRYDVSGSKIEDAVLTHRADRGGFFTMILQPPDRVKVEDITPKELVFVLDTSGSMSGFPIEKAKETMKLALEGLYSKDTFNLITFSGDTHILFPQPVAATAENLRSAQAFLASRRGGGGTEMMKAVTAALAPSSSKQHVRVVCFMTDGYVGNEAEIIREIERYSNARVFSFGIGGSVNRYLLDKMAEAGRGEVEYVALNGDGSAAARRFYERVRSPLLTDITVEWGDLPVVDVYPKRIPDVFSAKPIVITGRYTGAAKRNVRLRATYAGRPVTREILVDLPAAQPKHDVLATLWARTKIDTLAHELNTREEITQLGLNYRLMTQFTSFVAVEESIVTEGGKPRRVEVPVEMPEGVSYQGVFGEAASMMGGAGTGSLKHFRQIAGFAANSAMVTMQVSPPAAPPAKRAEIKVRDEMLSGGLPRTLKIDPTLLKQTGKVMVQIWLIDSTGATLASLKKMGLEITKMPGAMKLVMGRIDASKLKALSELAAVKYVAPVPVVR
ncbi:MAG TPA: VIT domain-containing protein [Bryobacteraceae bacterium]|nr:VIT domain-containing protein [Bryobacteraceae bacterium]